MKMSEQELISSLDQIFPHYGSNMRGNLNSRQIEIEFIDLLFDDNNNNIYYNLIEYIYNKILFFQSHGLFFPVTFIIHRNFINNVYFVSLCNKISETVSPLCINIEPKNRGTIHYINLENFQTNFVYDYIHGLLVSKQGNPLYNQNLTEINFDNLIMQQDNFYFKIIDVYRLNSFELKLTPVLLFYYPHHIRYLFYNILNKILERNYKIIINCCGIFLENEFFTRELLDLIVKSKNLTLISDINLININLFYFKYGIPGNRPEIISWNEDSVLKIIQKLNNTIEFGRKKNKNKKKSYKKKC